MADVVHRSSSAIRASQLAQLCDLLAVVTHSNAFYQRKLAAVRWNGAVRSLEEFSAHCPFTTKHELVEDQKAHPPYGTNLSFPAESYNRCHQTSGTTGTPLRWLDTPASWEWMLENWKEVYQAAGVTRSDRAFFAFSFGPFVGFWLAFEAATEIGCLCLPGGGLSSTARLRVILDHAATVLCCTPTYAIHLAEVAQQENIDLRASRVKTLIVAGEPGGSIPATRSRLEQLWPGARVFDHHGMTEVGPVTYECPKRPGLLHVIETAYYAEVVDPTTGRAVASGSVGELVLTTLGRTGSPLLRYRTGDLVRVAAESPQLSAPNPPPCPCGREEMTLDGGILGRVDDMIIVRGVNVYPSAVEDILRSCEGVGEYQVRVNTSASLTEISVQVEPAHERTAAQPLAARLETAFQSAFSLRIPVSLVPKGTLPRFELKAKRWVKG